MPDPLGPAPLLQGDDHAAAPPEDAHTLERAKQNIANGRASMNQLLAFANHLAEEGDTSDEDQIVASLITHGLSAIYGAVSAIAYATIAQAEHSAPAPPAAPAVDVDRICTDVWHRISNAGANTEAADQAADAVREALQP